MKTLKEKWISRVLNINSINGIGFISGQAQTNFKYKQNMVDRSLYIAFLWRIFNLKLIICSVLYRHLYKTAFLLHDRYAICMWNEAFLDLVVRNGVWQETFNLGLKTTKTTKATWLKRWHYYQLLANLISDSRPPRARIKSANEMNKFLLQYNRRSSTRSNIVYNAQKLPHWRGKPICWGPTLIETKSRLQKGDNNKRMQLKIR